MKLLHTSDWHLGQNFMGRGRLEEHTAFLEWLRDLIVSEGVDLLLVSGDIFDTGTPPNYALEMYYNFLRSLYETPCRRVIITAGNHDAVATLKAPRQVLKTLGVEVVTGEEAVAPIVIENEAGEMEAVVCAVPFLREGFVRKAAAGEGVQEKERLLQEGVVRYYERIAEAAREMRGERDIPIVGMGHLTTLGSKASESEREIYVGGSLHIDAKFFASLFDYTALGHLHKNQRVGENVWYSGSPLPLSFAEAKGAKRVNIVTFEERKPVVEQVEIPRFRALLSLGGTLHEVLDALEQVEDQTSWIEVEVDDPNPYEANRLIREKAEELGLTLLAVKLVQKEARLHAHEVEAISLTELTPLEVFEKRLEADGLEDEALKEALTVRFKTLLEEVERDEDS